MNAVQLTDIDRASFERDGFLVCRSMVDLARCRELAAIAREHLDQLIAPVEFEIEVPYPGAPVDPGSPGARTSRRLLQAYARHHAYRQWATEPALKQVLAELFHSGDEILLSQCHHNCVMTKEPGYSSVTLWHQDNRYWSFDFENLISVWLALGVENKSNGCLRVIPGSHKLAIDTGRFDASLFLRPDLPENKALLRQAKVVELNEGDVLFFHSRLFHAAGRNLTDETKMSAVFTYHERNNKPISDTRSDKFPAVQL